MTVGVLWLVSRAAGIVALVLLTATVVLGTLATGPTRSAAWPRWARQALHRDLALLSVGTLLVHVGAVVLDGYVDVGWYAALVPFTSAYRPLRVGLGTLALDLVLVVIATSLLRVRLGLRTWRAVHWLTYAAWPIAVLHYLTTGTDARAPLGRGPRGGRDRRRRRGRGAAPDAGRRAGPRAAPAARAAATSCRPPEREECPMTTMTRTARLLGGPPPGPAPGRRGRRGRGGRRRPGRARGRRLPDRPQARRRPGPAPRPGRRRQRGRGRTALPQGRGPAGRLAAPGPGRASCWPRRRSARSRRTCACTPGSPALPAVRRGPAPARPRPASPSSSSRPRPGTSPARSRRWCSCSPAARRCRPRGRPGRRRRACGARRRWCSTPRRWRTWPWPSTVDRRRTGRLGDPAEPGTLLVTVTGAVPAPGVLELPTGHGDRGRAGRGRGRRRRRRPHRRVRRRLVAAATWPGTSR